MSAEWILSLAATAMLRALALAGSLIYGVLALAFGGCAVETLWGREWRWYGFWMTFGDILGYALLAGGSGLAARHCLAYALAPILETSR
jgi:hypothetical protein